MADYCSRPVFNHLVNRIDILKILDEVNTHLQVLRMREEEFSNFKSLGVELIVVPRWKLVLPRAPRGNGPYGVRFEPSSSRMVNETKAPTGHSTPGL